MFATTGNDIAKVTTEKLQAAGITITKCSTGSGVSRTYLVKILGGEVKNYTPKVQAVLEYLDRMIVQRAELVAKQTEIMQRIQQNHTLPKLPSTEVTSINELPSMQTQQTSLPSMTTPPKKELQEM
jgi:predicted transcriptional regulator